MLREIGVKRGSGDRSDLEERRRGEEAPGSNLFFCFFLEVSMGLSGKGDRDRLGALGRPPPLVWASPVQRV